MAWFEHSRRNVLLELRPNCELCDCDLAPDSATARICSYECTFCADCVDGPLANVCPNCGGGFVARPIRPSREHREGASLDRHPASTRRVHTRYSEAEIRAFVNGVKDISPGQR
jgi:hypothetical protein